MKKTHNIPLESGGRKSICRNLLKLRTAKGIQFRASRYGAKLNGKSLLECSRVDVVDSNANVLLLAKQQQSVDHVAVVDFRNSNVTRGVGRRGQMALAQHYALYHGDANLLKESLEVVQRTSTVILGAISPKDAVSTPAITSAEMKTVAMILELAAPLQAGFHIRIENEPWMCPSSLFETNRERCVLEPWATLKDIWCGGTRLGSNCTMPRWPRDSTGLE